MSGNRKNLARVAAMFCITALMSFASIAMAHDGGWDGGHNSNHREHNFKKLAKKLGLTDAQKAQVKAIFQTNRETVKPIYTNLRAERKALHDLMHADKIDEAAIRAETAKIATVQADLNVNRANIAKQFRAILTPEQLTTLKSMKQKHHKRDLAPAITHSSAS